MPYSIQATPTPSNENVLRLLKKIEELQNGLIALRTVCPHEYESVWYYESDKVSGCYQIGCFDIICVCTKCGQSMVVQNTPPLCQRCSQSLVLKVWDGELMNDATDVHLSTWREESKRRLDMPPKELEVHGPSYTEIGLYVCVTEGCREEGGPQFYVTGGV